MSLDSKPLYAHQERVVSAAMLMPRLWINAAYGTGKSRMALEIIKRKKAKALVIAPLTLIETSWRGDHSRFGYEYRFRNMRDNNIAYQVDGAATPGTQLWIVNPEAFIRLKHLDLIDWDAIIIDEASRLKNRTSKIAKAVYEMSKRVKSVYLLSGNLAPNDESELWSPIRCLDPELLGESWYGFLNRYFYSEVGYAPGRRQFKKWHMRADKRQELADKLKRVSIRIGKEDAPELPPQTFIVREIELEPEQRRVYDELKKEWITQHKGETILAANALSELSKLRQIASGFIYNGPGTSLRLGAAKLQALSEVLDEIGNQQVVIFDVWQESIRQIKEALGEKAGCVYGEATATEKTDAIKAFQEGKLQYLVAHPRSGGVGLNLQNSCYTVHSSIDYSLEGHEQSLARISRSGQTRPCTHTFLLGRNTVDEAIYEALQKKADISKALQEAMR